MGIKLIKGQKVKINKIGDLQNSFVLSLTYRVDNPEMLSVDPFIFVINGNNRYSKENIVFYNNPISSCRGIAYKELLNKDEFIKTFEIDLNVLPQNVNNVVIGCELYCQREQALEKNEVDVTFKMHNKVLNTEVFTLDWTLVLSGETDSVVLGDIYKRNDDWKFNTVKHSGNEVITSLIGTLYSQNI